MKKTKKKPKAKPKPKLIHLNKLLKRNRVELCEHPFRGIGYGLIALSFVGLLAFFNWWHSSALVISLSILLGAMAAFIFEVRSVARAEIVAARQDANSYYLTLNRRFPAEQLASIVTRNFSVRGRQLIVGKTRVERKGNPGLVWTFRGHVYIDGVDMTGVVVERKGVYY